MEIIIRASQVVAVSLIHLQLRDFCTLWLDHNKDVLLEVLLIRKPVH